MYLRIQFTVISLLLLCVAGFNFIVDPYGVYLPDSSFDFSKKKVGFYRKEHFIKPYRVSDMKPDTVILGMSTAGLGYDESHPYFSDKSVYNFSMAGASMYMVYRAFQHSMIESSLQNVLLDLSVLSFNEYSANVVRNDKDSISETFESLIAMNEDGSRKWLAMFRQVTQIPQFLLSHQVIGDSRLTLKRQSSAAGWYLNRSGGWRGAALLPEESQGKRFMQIEKHLMKDFFENQSSAHSFSIYREDGSLSRSFDYYERLLDDAYRNNIQVTLVISPNHAYFYEAMDYKGIGEMLTDWKRNVVLINEKVAGRHGKTPFPVWDFAYYSAINTEPVPAEENSTARMTWFNDPIHFLRVTGDHMLDQIFLGIDGSGVKLTANTLDAVMEMQQQKKQQFQRENPEEIKRLNAMFKRVSKASEAAKLEQP